MPILNVVQELEFGQVKGIDLASPLALVQPGYCREAVNADIGFSGGYTKRGGFAASFGTTWGTYNIRAGVEYMAPSGTRYPFLQGTDDATASEVSYKDGTAIHAPSVQTGIAYNKRVSFVQTDTRLFMFNGDTTNMPRVWILGQTARAIGIPASTGVPVAVSNVDGSLTTGGFYIFSYTFYNSSTGAESSPSPLSVAVAAGAHPNDGFTLTLNKSYTPAAEVADYIRVYRTVSDGSQLFFDKQVATSSTTVSITNSDAALTDPMEEDNSQITDLDTLAPDYPVLARNRIFVRTDANEIRFSKIGLSGPMPESFEVKSLVSTLGSYGAGDKIVGLNQIKGTVVVLKEKSVGILEEAGIPAFDVVGDNVTYNYREIDARVGAVSHFAATQVYDELFFLGRDNVYAIGGSGIRRVADSIKPLIRSLNFTTAAIAKVSIANDIRNSRIYISVLKTTTSTQPDLVLVGHYHNYPEVAWTTYEPGANTTTHPGIRPGSFFSLFDGADGSDMVYFGATLGTGQFYKMNQTTYLDVNKQIYFKVLSRPFCFNQPFTSKLYLKAYAQVAIVGGATNVVSSVAYDLAESTENPYTHALSGSSELWADGTTYTKVWADDAGVDTSALKWQANSLNELSYSLHRRAKFAQIQLLQSDVASAVTVFGMGIFGSAMAQR